MPNPVAPPGIRQRDFLMGWRHAGGVHREALALLRLYVAHGKPPCLYPLDDGRRCCECEACGAGLSMSPALERALGSALDRGK